MKIVMISLMFIFVSCSSTHKWVSKSSVPVISNPHFDEYKEFLEHSNSYTEDYFKNKDIIKIRFMSSQGHNIRTYAICWESNDIEERILEINPRFWYTNKFKDYWFMKTEYEKREAFFKDFTKQKYMRYKAIEYGLSYCLNTHSQVNVGKELNW